MYIYDNSSPNSSWNEKVQTNLQRKIKTHLLSNKFFLPKIVPFLR